MRGKRGTWGGKVKDHDYAGYSEGSGGGRGDYYCLFRVNYFFMLVLEIEASKPLRNDLKSC